MKTLPEKYSYTSVEDNMYWEYSNTQIKKIVHLKKIAVIFTRPCKQIILLSLEDKSQLKEFSVNI